VVITDPGGRPSLAINAPDFLRDALLKDGPADPLARAWARGSGGWTCGPRGKATT
jgi:hypothetical protein